MTFETFSHFAGTWGLLWLVLMFACALGYALWPRNTKMFEDAAYRPLMDDDQDYDSLSSEKNGGMNHGN